MFSRWRIIDELANGNVKVNASELVVCNVLLIVGGMVLGYGLASFANFALGFALSISGGVMLFAGIFMTIRTLSVVVNATTNATNSAK